MFEQENTWASEIYTKFNTKIYSNKKKNIVSSIISRYMYRATVAVVVIREVCLLVKLNENYLHVYLLYDSFSPGTVAVCDVTI